MSHDDDYHTTLLDWTELDRYIEWGGVEGEIYWNQILLLGGSRVSRQKLPAYLHTLVEQFEDAGVAHQCLNVVFQALCQPTQQVQSHNHEVFVWRVILIWLGQIGLHTQPHWL